MKQYEVPEMEILRFKNEDVITGSDGVHLPPIGEPEDQKSKANICKIVNRFCPVQHKKCFRKRLRGMLRSSFAENKEKRGA